MNAAQKKVWGLRRYLGIAVTEVLTVQSLAPLGLQGATAGHMFLHSLLERKPYMLSPVLVQQLPPPQLSYFSLAQKPLQLLNNDDTFQSTSELQIGQDHSM